MFPAIYHPLNSIAFCIIFLLMFENGRTEESFECRTEFIPPGSTESVNMTCCSKIKLGEYNKVFWRKYDKGLGTCTPYSSAVHGYVCYSYLSLDRYRIETCGPNCFVFGIVQLTETDLGEYYITLSNWFSVLLAKALVLNLTALAPDIEHEVTMNSSSLSHTTTASFPLSMSCSYSEQVSTSSSQSSTFLAPENATESSSTNEFTKSSHITYMSDDYREDIATNIIERNHSDVVTNLVNQSNVEVTNDDNKNVITILFILVIFSFLFGLVMCLYIIICKIRKFRKKKFKKQLKNDPDTKSNDCAEIGYENKDIVQSSHSRPKSNRENRKVVSEIASEHAYLSLDDLEVDNEDGERERGNIFLENGSQIHREENESIRSDGSNTTLEIPNIMTDPAYCTHIERFKEKESDQDEREMEGHIALQDVYLFGHDLIGSHGADESSPKYESII